MSCFHPKVAWDLTPDFENGIERIVNFSVPLEIQGKLERQGRRLSIPCRKCLGCRLAKSREWANRAVMEQCYHDQSWFLTLTYDDDHLPRSFATDQFTGEIISVHGTLVKKDLQDFLKRLRKNARQSFRYFSAGEYGGQTFRPHYHLLIFGLSLDDLSVVSRNFAGQQYYVSDIISKCWPQGIHILGPVSWQSAAYVARYTMKKANSDYNSLYYVQANIQPEYQTMSLKPGLGYQYYLDHSDIFEFDSFSVSTPQGGRIMYPPEYFKKKFREEHPKEYLKRSLQCRRNSEVKEHLKLLLTDKDYSDILKDEERRLFSKISSLTRNDI